MKKILLIGILILLALSPVMAVDEEYTLKTWFGTETGYVSDGDNLGSSVVPTFVAVDNPYIPVSINYVGYNRPRRYTYSDNTISTFITFDYNVETTESLVAFEMTFLLLDLYGRPLWKVVLQHAMDVEKDSTVDGFFVLDEVLSAYEIASLNNVVAYISAVRTASGTIYVPHEDVIIEAVSERYPLVEAERVSIEGLFDFHIKSEVLNDIPVICLDYTFAHSYPGLESQNKMTSSSLSS